jgi:hypothetical protein
MSDDREPSGLDRRRSGEQIEARAQAGHLGLDGCAVPCSPARIARPGEATLRQETDDAVPGELHRFIDELRPVAIRRLVSNQCQKTIPAAPSDELGPDAASTAPNAGVIRKASTVEPSGAP